MSQFNDYYGGGGYVQGSPYSASGSPGGLRNKDTSHSLRPLTVAQVVKATQAHTDAEWMVDDAEVGQITIVGQVTNIQTQTTNSVYWIEDGTGRIETRHWIDSTSEEDVAKWGGIDQGMNVRVTGSLKTFGNKRYINANHIKVVRDPHEIYFHILECIAVTLTIERGPPYNHNPDAPAVTTRDASAYSNPSQPSAINDQFSHYPALHRAILKFLNEQPKGDMGIHVSDITRAVSKYGDANKISDALDKLMDEGAVYTTIDDSHFEVSS